ncbi:MAG: ABC transporter substrate-binding protein [Candidatus Lambdaproteobacteria bacterium]|nr:ABC transporter substrate-binding protein [Candidatus Lambdaproteobacteria bacterium]
MKHFRMLMAMALACAGLTIGAPLSAQKYGGILRVSSDADPPSLSIHEGATNRVTWAVAPMYNNLVTFDAFDPKESLETIVPDLAERWDWSADRTALTFTLNKGARWHDGTPMTAKDVKHTFDLVRGTSTFRLKLNSRKLWYANVQAIETAGDHQVVFRLKRPQPSILAMLASGYSPVYPAHVDPAQLRTTALGTGPFKLKSYIRGRTIEMTKNADYFVKLRPYLDGVKYTIITSTASHTAALMANQVDAANPTFTHKPIAENLKVANVGIQFIPIVGSGTSNIVVNTNKPPLKDLDLRRAVNLALDRASIVKSVFHGGAVIGASMLPQPHGAWGLSSEKLLGLPGYGDPEKARAEARRLLAAKGYGPGNPLKIVVSTRTSITYVEPAAWAIGELKAVGVEAELKQVETGNWHGLVARRDFQLAVNSTGLGADDPDIQFYENFRCHSQRNYSDYCNPEVERLVDQQSMESDLAKRRAIVNQVDIRLTEDVARPQLAYRIYFNPHYPYVKNWVPHASSYNGWRLTEVWLDK